MRCMQSFLLLTILLISCQGDQPPGSHTAEPEQPISWLDSILTVEFPSDEPGICILVKHGEDILLRKAYGLASLELQVPLEPEMIFGIGSATKPIVAAAVMILVEREQISLDTPIGSIIPELSAPASDATIRQLLSHTSGIPDLLASEGYWQGIREDVTLAEITERICDLQSRVQPGDGWNYSNSNYYLLGTLTERISLEPYQDFLQREILDPAGMTQTVFALNNPVIPGRVQGHRRREWGIENAPMMSYSQLQSAGGLFANVDDLSRWATAFFGGIIVTQKSLQEITSTVVLNNGEAAGFGLGWYLGTLEGQPMVYHGGGIFGFVCHTLYLPESRVYVAILNNLIDRRRSPSTQKIAEYAASWALGRSDPFQQQAALKLNAKEQERYAGTYRFIAGSSRNIGKNRKVMSLDGKLYFGKNRMLKIELLPLNHEDFLVKGMLDTLHFTHSDSGTITGIRAIKSDGVLTILQKLDQ